jgi:hypothetical protein
MSWSSPRVSVAPADAPPDAAGALAAAAGAAGLGAWVFGALTPGAALTAAGGVAGATAADCAHALKGGARKTKPSAIAASLGAAACGARNLRECAT